MNYLAHLHLADFTGTSLAGSLMGDVVRGPLQGLYAPVIEIGIRLHRSIDSFTDAHPVVRAAKARFEPPYRRYAGILLDVYFDHCLASAWEHYHSLTLEEFTSHAQVQLEEEARQLQHPGFALRLSYMRTRNLLLSYRALSGVDYALKGLSTRLTRTNPLASALPVLLQQQTHLKNDFRAFYPQLIQHAQAITQELVT